MALLITARNFARHAALMEKVYRFRHRHFVELLKWDALRKPDGREIDQFDRPDNVHIVGVEHGEINHYARLLPTTRPHLQTHVYPQLLQGGVAPSGPAIVEWTRQAIDPASRESPAGGKLALASGWLSVIEAFHFLGIEGALIQTHPALVTRVMQVGFDVRPLALPAPYRGDVVLPIFAKLTPNTLSAARNLFGVKHSLLEIEPDLLPQSPMPRGSEGTFNAFHRTE